MRGRRGRSPSGSSFCVAVAAEAARPGGRVADSRGPAHWKPVDTAVVEPVCIRPFSHHPLPEPPVRLYPDKNGLGGKFDWISI